MLKVWRTVACLMFTRVQTPKRVAASEDPKGCEKWILWFFEREKLVCRDRRCGVRRRQERKGVVIREKVGEGKAKL